MGCPIQTSPDHSLFTSSPKLIAGYRVFHRLLTPRHPPCALMAWSHQTVATCARGLAVPNTPGRSGLTRVLNLLASQSKSHSTIKHSLLSILHFATLGRDHGRRGPFSEPLSCFQGLRDPSGTVLGADVKRIRLSKMPPRVGINPAVEPKLRFPLPF